MTTQEQPNNETLPLVRQQVKRLLSRSKAFRDLSAAKQKAVAHDTVKIANYMADAHGVTKDAPISAVLAHRPVGQDAPISAVLARDTAGKDFAEQGGATAAQAGVEALGDVVNKVDFPGFVGGLIEGVFNAIVKASIDQMEAYGELVANVAKSVDEYMRDNITEDQARDYLVDRYPDHLEADMGGERPTLRPREDRDEDNMPDFFKDLGLPLPIDDLDEETVEQQLVPAARKRIAMDRQQLLATMVLMGINRLIVTDGRINASVIFTLNTKDAITRALERSTSFEANTRYRRRRKGFFFVPDTRYSRRVSLNVETTQSDDSEASVKLKTTMKGNVDLRFRSETFPLERMTEMLNVNRERIEDVGRGGGRDDRPGAAAAPPPLAPPPPTPAT